MSKLLQLENVTKSFGGTTVVNNVSFGVEEGEIFGVLGPNGAGKSTTIRCILGIIQPDSGEVRFGFSPRGVPRSQIGYLPEERGMYKDVPVMDIILYLARLKDYPVARARQRALELLERLDLKGKDKAKVEELSKGMAQKVQFIASVIHEPKLLILDEPFSGLDPVSQNVMRHEIKELTKKGTSILLSAHQMNLVEELCDRIFLINKGEQVVYGKVSAVKEQYADYKCVIHGDNDHIAFETLTTVRHVERDRSRTTVYLRNDVPVQRLLQELPTTVEIREMHVDRISLHDIFVAVATGGDRNHAR